MENLVPKRAFTLLNAKLGEEIYEICIKLMDIPGAVSEVARTLSQANVNLRNSVLFDAVEENGVGYWTAFADLAKATANTKQLEEVLRKLDVVKEVKIAKPAPLPYDIMHFPLIHDAEAAVVMPLSLFGSLFDEIERILTPSGFAAVFYNAGKKSGVFIVKLLKDRYKVEKENIISALIQAAKAIGWGCIENVDIKNNAGKVKIRMCFEALLRTHREHKGCHWTRGFIAGALGEVFGLPLEAIEVKCLAEGDDACVFEVKPKI